MLHKKKISVIIPCRNEAKGLKSLLLAMPSYVDEVVVVDNNSVDGTRSMGRKYGAVVVSEKRVDRLGIGYGYAHQAGMETATGDIVLTMDGDGTYPLDQINEVVDFMLAKKIDFLVCSRFPLMEGQAISLIRKLGVFILNTVTSLLYSYPIQDILSGMWVMNRKAIRLLNPMQGGWDLSPEIKLEALRHPGMTFGQCHIQHYRREHGRSKQKLWVTGTNHLRYILKRRFTVDNSLLPAFKLWLRQSDLVALRHFFEA